MTLERQVVARAEATRALAARLRKAAVNGHDEDRCQAEAEAFIGELTRRGWHYRPLDAAPTWQQRATPADPEAVERAAAEARRAIRERRGLDDTHFVGDTCDPPHTHPAEETP